MSILGKPQCQSVECKGVLGSHIALVGARLPMTIGLVRKVRLMDQALGCQF